MNEEYEKRADAIGELTDSLGPFCSHPDSGLVLTGSMGYAQLNKEVITPSSDIDMTLIADPKNLDYRRFYKSLRLPYDDVVERCAKEHRASIFIIRWKAPFEIGLNLWDISTFERVVNFSRQPERTLREKDFNGVSMAGKLFGLSGKILEEDHSHRTDYQGRVIQSLHPTYEDGHEIYLSSLINGMMMSPKVLIEHRNNIERKLKHTRNVLAEHVERVYGHKRLGLSFANALPEKIKAKIPPVLLENLNDVIRNQ